jgi:hypothetical protein
MPTGALYTEPKYRNALLHIDGLGSEMETGTTSSSAVTINGYTGLITTEALSTAAGAVETITLTNNKIDSGDAVYCTVANGTNSAGIPMVATVTPADGSCTIVIMNNHASAAVSGTLLVGFIVMKAVSGL